MKDAPAETVAEETGVHTEKGTVVEILLENEEKCSEKMKRDPPYNGSGKPFSTRTFWLHVVGFCFVTRLCCRSVLRP